MSQLVTAPFARRKFTPRHARPGANPTLALVEAIEGALRAAGEPVSRNWLLEQLARWGQSTNRPTLNAALRFLADVGHVGEGSKGIVYFPQAKGKALEYIRLGLKG